MELWGVYRSYSIRCDMSVPDKYIFVSGDAPPDPFGTPYRDKVFLLNTCAADYTCMDLCDFSL